MSLTWISTNVAITATGSTADMSAAKTKQWSNSNSVPPYNGVKLNPHRVKPIRIVLNKVFAKANSKIVPILSKKGLKKKKIFKTWY